MPYLPLNNAAIAAKNVIPSEFICPISGQLMQNPVSTPCNHTFEASNIYTWVFNSFSRHDQDKHDSCPVCRARIKIPGAETFFTENTELRRRIAEFKTQNSMPNPPEAVLVPNTTPSRRRMTI